MKVSIIIRVLNERENLRHCLNILKSQDHKDQEIIIVNNESDDGTPEVANSFNCVLARIERNEFSMPKALNLGARLATGEILVLMSAHSFPIGEKWLSKGLKHFSDLEIAGVYGPVLAHKNSGFAETLFYLPGYIKCWLQGVKLITSPEWGGLAFTNAAIRRSLWEIHPFDESYGLGGEDGEWSTWALNAGYKFIKDPAFVVRHAHGLGLRELIAQCSYWRNVSKPQPFSREKLNFRKEKHFGSKVSH